MTPAEHLALMQADWGALVGQFGIGEAAAGRVFDQLVAAYASPGRWYHTLEHLGEMFQVINRLAPDIDDLPAVRLATWFHDVVYDTHASDNEEQSAAQASERLGSLDLPAALIDRVGQLILATAHLDSEAPAHRDMAALLDADLAILGAPPERYLRYSRDIRQEYAWVPESSYRAKRDTVLQKFLARPRIYHCRTTFEEREEQARRNIAGELSLLDEMGTVCSRTNL